jgi:hypothetical protein
MSGQIVGKRWIIGKHKLDNARAVTALKPLHELRQEFVSQLCAKYGIYAASRMLRHADRASAVWKERMPKTTADRVAVHRKLETQKRSSAKAEILFFDRTLVAI